MAITDFPPGRTVWVTALVWTLLPTPPTNAQAFPAADLVRLTDRYCVGPDGDHELTWALAVRDGLTPLSPDDFADLRLPGARQLRGFTETIDGAEVRVLTAVNRLIGMDAGMTSFHLCWVSAQPIDRRPVEAELRRQLGMRGFRQEDARMFAWVPLPDGSIRRIGRPEWSRRSQAIAREEGMRAVMVNDYQGMVAITYMTPTDSCDDWCY